MKQFIFGFMGLISFAALASGPGIGSFSSYNVNGAGVSGSYVIEISGYNSAKDEYTQTYITSINGSSSIEDAILPGDQVNSKSENALVVDLCETNDVGGKLEVIKTPAGTFDTCKLVTEAGETIYMAAVPFGFVKLISPDGIVFELEDYAFRN